MSPRPRPKSQHGDAQKRARILRATVSVVSSRGLASAPMSLIARRAGVAAGTIYYYFRGKDDLLRQVYLHVKANPAEAIKDSLPASGGLRELLHAVWHGMVGYYLAHSAEFTYLGLFENSRLFTGDIKRDAMKSFAPLLAMVEAGVARGELRAMPTEMFVALIHGFAVELCKQHLHGVLTVNRRLLEQGFEACWRAIAAA
jgi:AcrR family transcriptional regulator